MKIISFAGQVALVCLLVVALVLELDLVQLKRKQVIASVTIGAGAIVAMLGLAVLLNRHSNGKYVPADLFALMLVCIFPLLLAFYSIGIEGLMAPDLNDISTDVENPPPLVYAAMMRSVDENSSVYPDELAGQQLAAYPDIKSLNVTASYREAFNLSIYVASLLGWSILNENIATGLISLRSKTKFLAFKADIAIRITRIDANNSIVDVRSASVSAERDFAINAHRIRTFFAGFNAELRKRQMH